MRLPRKWPVLCALLCLLNLPATVVAATKRVVIAGDDWCPINCDQFDERRGVMIEVATAAFERAGYSVDYVEMPWTRAIRQARAGVIHAVVGAFKDDVPDFYFPREPILYLSPSNLFALKTSNWRYTDIPSISAVKLGVIRGYDYGDKLNQYIRSVLDADTDSVSQLYGNSAIQRNIELLSMGRIDVLVETGPVFWYYAEKMQVADKFQLVGSVGSAEPCYIAFSPSVATHREFASVLDDGVRQMRLNGELAQIAERYNVPVTFFEPAVKSE